VWLSIVCAAILITLAEVERINAVFTAAALIF
jgi:hypothetical protein